jgi:hypothetical protein
VSVTGVVIDDDGRALLIQRKDNAHLKPTNPEVTAFQWASKSDVDDMVAEAFAIRISDAYHCGIPAAIREHDGVHLL